MLIKKFFAKVFIMKRTLLKILVTLMIGVVAHDYFIKQCDIFHVQKCDILQDHSKHQLLHIEAVVDEKPPNYELICLKEVEQYSHVLKTQYFFKTASPPPKRS